MSTKSEALKKRMIRRHELRQIVPLADTTIYEMEQRGEFPRRFALTPRCVVWDLAEVEAWLTERLATARRSPIDRAPHPDVRKRKARPGSGPTKSSTAAPLRMIAVPFTNTCSMPAENWWGSA